MWSGCLLCDTLGDRGMKSSTSPEEPAQTRVSDPPSRGGRAWMAPGGLLAGKYRLERKLGKGSMGLVWAATHLALETPVAIKFLTWDVPSEGETVEQASKVAEKEAREDKRARFEREAKAAAQIRSANVVQVFDYGVDRGVPFIVMELLEGEDLNQRLQREGKLTPAATARLVQALSRALQRAHDVGLVHRDLKPGNIFLAKEGDHEVPKVVDFGVVKAMRGEQKLATEGSENTVEGTLIGTPSYMSPEQAMGRTDIDHRSDLWSVGVILFQVLTGMKPFPGGNLFEALVRILLGPHPAPLHDRARAAAGHGRVLRAGSRARRGQAVPVGARARARILCERLAALDLHSTRGPSRVGAPAAGRVAGPCGAGSRRCDAVDSGRGRHGPSRAAKAGLDDWGGRGPRRARRARSGSAASRGAHDDGCFARRRGAGAGSAGSHREHGRRELPGLARSAGRDRGVTGPFSGRGRASGERRLVRARVFGRTPAACWGTGACGASRGAASERAQAEARPRLLTWFHCVQQSVVMSCAITEPVACPALGAQDPASETDVVKSTLFQVLGAAAQVCGGVKVASLLALQFGLPHSRTCAFELQSTPVGEPQVQGGQSRVSLTLP